MPAITHKITIREDDHKEDIDQLLMGRRNWVGNWVYRHYEGARDDVLINEEGDFAYDSSRTLAANQDYIILTLKEFLAIGKYDNLFSLGEL